MPSSVLANELAWHEHEAQRRVTLDAVLYGPPAFAPVSQTSLDFLALQPGERVLDMGGGEGKEAQLLAQTGATVICTDLSPMQLRRARQRVFGAPAHFVQADAAALPFAAASFRVVHGKAIVHHLELGAAVREVGRLLAPGGRAVFAEPLAHHPLFWLARTLTPQLRTRDEHPLTFPELQQFGAAFARAEIETYFLFAPLSYLFRLLPGGEPVFRWLHTRLNQLDQWLFRRVPGLKRWAWYGVIKLVKLG